MQMVVSPAEKAAICPFEKDILLYNLIYTNLALPWRYFENMVNITDQVILSEGGCSP